jgi:hypothetical protein
MKLAKFILFGLVISAMTTRAALVAYWDFNNLQDPISTSLSSAAGSQNLVADFTSFPANALAFANGTTLNSVGTSPAGTALSILRTPGINPNSGFMEIQLTMSGLSQLTVSYAQTDSLGNGGSSLLWSYRVGDNTGAFTSLPATPVTGTAWTTASFAAPTALDNQAVVFLRAALSKEGNRETFDLDNLQLNAVPEPVNLALSVFALCVVSVGISRRLGRRIRS